MMRKRKKNIVSLFLGIAILGSVIAPMRVSAVQEETSAEVVEPYVIYVPVTGEKMKASFGKQAPQDADITKKNSKIIAKYTQGTEKGTKELDSIDGYYFGGWYATPSEEVAIKYEEHKNEIAEDATVYAKFVPSYMLNVKVQNASELNDLPADNTYASAAATADIKTSSLRMVSSIDSTRYKEVGFHVFVNGKKVSKMSESVYNKTVYDMIKGINKNGAFEYTAKKLFGMEGKLMIAKFINIPVAAWGTSIYVRPYWITFDGIEVRGNGKYIHMEDGILGYMTIPVNVQGVVDATSGGVAAGKLSVSYATEEMELVDVKSSNCMLDTVVWDADEENGKIKFVAVEKNNGKVKNIVPNNYGAEKRQTDEATEAYTYETVNNMYATLRFTKGTATPTAGYRVNFADMEFCNETENFVSVNMWNVRY